MATKFGKDEDAEVELELCLSLGGPLKKATKAQPIECCPDGNSNAVIRWAKDIDVDLNVETRKKREAKQQRSGGGGECKRIKTEVTNGVDLGLSFSNLGNGYGSGQYKENSKDVTIGSPIGSTSDVYDPCQEGGSCELGVSSNRRKPVNSPVNNNILTYKEERAWSMDGPNDAVVEETQQCSNSITKEAGKPPKPRPNSNGVNGSLLPFAKMPCVTSTGNGPDGKTVNGFLYRYSKSEISIICVCHGTSFSPAEFIIHAGGTNVSHPLRHITVVPSTF
ncbi:nuclear transport factor 2 (NTF2) family protein / RNA recognition motif (RRM)-containing protein [Raphanus sativus]|uniref:Ninja-family protein n=1 Tax=Raphanus sativus TaxID=3726 RepID=A0A6J0P228_RAPSA|nr:ninja-family protein AFP2-like [Raphanus sativus]KAJ4898377.1 nuclear transport factor 2 (NTF2) family protein / RNA recognition motif (RRM)-containing protein [Raphanus sativus]